MNLRLHLNILDNILRVSITLIGDIFQKVHLGVKAHAKYQNRNSAKLITPPDFLSNGSRFRSVCRTSSVGDDDHHGVAVFG